MVTPSRQNLFPLCNTADCVVDPPNRRIADHVPTAFLAAAAGTELPDYVNRSIRKTYLVENI
jgi:hypothetical protein